MVSQGNNGDALTCAILGADDFAVKNHASVTFETQHDERCQIFSHIRERGLTNEKLAQLRPTSDEALRHLYFCNCDVGIEAVFSRGDGDRLFIPFTLSDLKAELPWLGDPETTQEMLAGARRSGPGSKLIKTLRPVFRNRVSRHIGMILESDNTEIH